MEKVFKKIIIKNKNFYLIAKNLVLMKLKFMQYLKKNNLKKFYQGFKNLQIKFQIQCQYFLIK